MKNTHKKAFTLVELKVVITILAILWTIAFIVLAWTTATQCAPWVSEITLSNGQTWSCMNLWATTVRDWVTQPTKCNWSSTNCNSWLTWLWNYYQWWRNDIWFDVNWNTGDDAWWHTTNTNIARKWPCDAWWHVPTVSEWKAACDAISWTNCANNSTTINVLKRTLRLPFAGYRYWNNGYYNIQSTDAYYWSSTPNSINAHNLNFNTSDINPANNFYRAYGFSVRCLKN